MSAINSTFVSKIEQRINLQFLIKLGKNEDETFRLLKKVYGDRCMSRAAMLSHFGRSLIEEQNSPSVVDEIEDVSKYKLVNIMRTCLLFFLLVQIFHFPKDASILQRQIALNVYLFFYSKLLVTYAEYIRNRIFHSIVLLSKYLIIRIITNNDILFKSLTDLFVLR